MAKEKAKQTSETDNEKPVKTEAVADVTETETSDTQTDERNASKHQKPKPPVKPLTPAEMEAELSKRNVDYLFKLRKGLAESTLPEDKQAEIIQQLIPEMLTAQHKGQTATALYGPVSTKLNNILHAPKPPKQTPTWLMSLDMSLLFLTFFAGLYGVLGYFMKSFRTSAYGWITLILVAIAAGALMTITSRWSSTSKAKRGSIWKMVGVVIVGMVVLSILLAITTAIPASINVKLTPIAEIIVAIAAFGIHYYLKKRFKLNSLNGIMGG